MPILLYRILMFLACAVTGVFTASALHSVIHDEKEGFTHCLHLGLWGTIFILLLREFPIP